MSESKRLGKLRSALMYVRASSHYDENQQHAKEALKVDDATETEVCSEALNYEKRVDDLGTMIRVMIWNNQNYVSVSQRRGSTEEITLYKEGFGEIVLSRPELQDIMRNLMWFAEGKNIDGKEE